MVFGLFRKSPEQEAEDQARIQASLTKTRQGFFGRVGALFQANEITDETWDELEELLIQADLGINTAMGLVERLRGRVGRDHLKRVDDVKAALKDELVRLLDHAPFVNISEPRMLTVVLIVGVNGSGKTTSIAKLARYYKARGKELCWRLRILFARQQSTNSRFGANVLEWMSSHKRRARTQARLFSTPSEPVRKHARPICS